MILRKAAAVLIAEAVNKWICEHGRRNAPVAVNPLRYLAKGSFDWTLAFIQMDLD